MNRLPNLRIDYSMFILLFLAALSCALDCSADQVFVQIFVTTKRYGEEQIIQIRGDGIRTAIIQNLFNNCVNTREACVAHTANDQYTLALRDEGEDGWDKGSYVDIQNAWGATVFRGRMESGSIQYYSLSLYAPITPDSEWQFSTTFVPDWTDVSAAIANWNSYVSGNWTESVTGTQYFRKEVRALTNLAAYDLRVFYASGVVAYVNGVEVFRDNMPEGVPTAATLATGSYETADYRGVVRSGMDLLNPNAVIAIEVHFESTASRPVTFKAALSQMSSVSTSSNCHMIGGFDVSNSETNLVDFNDETTYSVSSNEGIVFYNWTNMRVMVNAWTIGIGAVDVAPTSFAWEGGMSSESTTAIGSVEMSGYEANRKYLTNYVLVNSTYSTYKMTMSGSGSSIGLKGLHPMVCSQMPPESIGYNRESFYYRTAVEIVDIESMYKGFVNCTSSPALPEGVSIDSECHIRGSSVVSGSGEYTVSGWIMEKNVSSVITLTFAETLLEVPVIYYSQTDIVLARNKTITPLVPTILGSDYTLSVTPSLPEGLVMDLETGKVSGTPSQSVSDYQVVVTIQNLRGSNSVNLTFTILVPISSFAYARSEILLRKDDEAMLVPAVDGEQVLFSVASGSLPEGLVLSAQNGTIFGVPTTMVRDVAVTIEAANRVSSKSTLLFFSVFTALSELSYPSRRNFLVKGSPFSMTPSVKGENPVFSIEGSLPEGLQLNTTSGEIEGVPTKSYESTRVTVSAKNEVSSMEVVLSFTILPLSIGVLVVVGVGVVVVIVCCCCCCCCCCKKKKEELPVRSPQSVRVGPSVASQRASSYSSRYGSTSQSVPKQSVFRTTAPSVFPSLP